MTLRSPASRLNGRGAWACAAVAKARAQTPPAKAPRRNASLFMSSPPSRYVGFRISDDPRIKTLRRVSGSFRFDFLRPAQQTARLFASCQRSWGAGAGRQERRPSAIPATSIVQLVDAQGFITGRPAAANALTSRVATANPWAAAMATIYPSGVGKPLHWIDRVVEVQPAVYPNLRPSARFKD